MSSSRFLIAILAISLRACKIDAFSRLLNLPSPCVVGMRGRTSVVAFPPVAPIDPKSALKSSTNAAPSPLHEAFPMRTNPLLVVGLLGGLMCGAAGYLNAITFLLLERTSMHVTGVMTKTSISFVSGELAMFLELAFQLVIFVVGSTIASFIVGGEQKFKGGQHHTKVLALITGIVGLGAFLSASQMLLASSLMTCAAGMQNGMTTSYSGAVVRSTHITGTITDMGTETAQILMGRSTNPWKLQVLSAFALFYFFGGILGSMLATKISVVSAISLAAIGYGLIGLGNCLFCMGKLRFVKRVYYAVFYPETIKMPKDYYD